MPYVPVDTAVPSRWRVIQRDGAASVFAVFFGLGLVAAACYFADPKLGVDWLVTGLVIGSWLPLRLWRIRRLFRHGREVVGRVASQHRGGRATTVTYEYELDGHRYSGKCGISLATSIAYNASVPVMVDPDRPSRSLLKHAFILEEVEPIARAQISGKPPGRRRSESRPS